MKRLVVCLVLSLVPVSAFAADLIAPDWAYPELDPAFQKAKDDGQVQHVPGSTQGFTRAEIGGVFGSADWFPDEHPPLPDVIKHGRPPSVRACGGCHLPNGLGHADSASVAGLTETYFIEQMRDFQNGTRANSLTHHSAGMITTAKAMTDDEIKETAAYYAGQKPKPWVEVKEVDTVPVTIVGNGNLRQVKEGAGDEPLGERIIELPVNLERTSLRDPHSGFIAYVPKGSIKKGEDLVKTGGNGKTLACGACHGADLKGAGDVPRVAGLHPIFVVRQMLDIQQGTRNGADIALMKPVAAKLSLEDMIDISAYVASLTP